MVKRRVESTNGLARNLFRLGMLLGAVGACTDESVTPAPQEPTGWTPGHHLPSDHDGPRGLLDVRGLIHAHSVYSHDACDGEPRDPTTDAINEPCFDDFRRDLCTAGHDFVMLTDHDDSFSRTEYPEVLLYRPDRGRRARGARRRAGGELGRLCGG
jgi:hypothetical protein